MRYLIDTHCHTIASGHAYSTVLEIAREANNKGLEMVGITDHGPSMAGSPHIFHFANQKVIPPVIYGVEILRGAEVNIINDTGELDLPEWILKRLDVVIASLHDICIEPGNVEYNTRALIKAMENPYVDIIAHPGNPVFPIDKEAVVKKAKETDTLIEINNSSFISSRPGSKDNCKEIARLCKENDVRVMAGSDAHIAFDVGRFDKIIELFSEIQMPQGLVVNLSPDKFKAFLRSKGKKRFISTDTPVV